VKQKMLEGIRIADLTTVIFGPYCTQILADLGASVVKVEPAVGDAFRLVGQPPVTAKMGPGHLRLNRGKRSVVWDLKSPAGRLALNKLIESSDVFIHNIRSEAVARMGMTYEVVKAIKPDIVYVHCSGFNSSGPYSSLPAYDDIIQAGAGITSLLPHVDGNPAPRYFPMAMADKVSGLHAAYAVLAALLHRERTGEGQKVEVPMLESVASFTLLEHLSNKTFIPPTGTSLYKRRVDPGRQPFRTKDGYISIAPYLEYRWVRLFAAAGRGDIVEAQNLNATGLGLAKHEDILLQALRTITPDKTTAEWLALCKDAEVPAMRANTVDELLEDPHMNAVGMFKRRIHPTEGEYIEVQPPVKFSARPFPEPSHAPQIGENTAEVLRELGMAP